MPAAGGGYLAGPPTMLLHLKPACLLVPAAGYASYKVRGANGSPQQIKVAKHTAVAMHIRQQLWGKMGGEGSRRGWPDNNKLTLVQIQSETH